MTKERISRNNGVREKVDLTELLAGVEVRVGGMVRALTFESTHAWDRLWNRHPFFGEVFFTCTAGFFCNQVFFLFTSVSFDSYHIIAIIPAGARNIIISEARASYNDLCKLSPGDR